MTENPTPAHAGLDLGDADFTWFWAIVDKDGLTGLPSVESEALRILVDRAARADTLAREAAAKDAKIAALKEALEPFGAKASYWVGKHPRAVGTEVITVSSEDLRRAARLAPANREKGRDHG